MYVKFTKSSRDLNSKCKLELGLEQKKKQVKKSDIHIKMQYIYKIIKSNKGLRRQKEIKNKLSKTLQRQNVWTGKSKHSQSRGVGEKTFQYCRNTGGECE